MSNILHTERQKDLWEEIMTWLNGQNLFELCIWQQKERQLRWLLQVSDLTDEQILKEVCS